MCNVLQADHKTAGHATSRLDTKTESGFSKMGGNDLVKTVVSNGSSAKTCSTLCYSKSFSYNVSIKLVFLSASPNANGCLLSCFRTPEHWFIAGVYPYLHQAFGRYLYVDVWAFKWQLSNFPSVLLGRMTSSFLSSEGLCHQ